jgi:hypothetical protein
MFKLSTCKDIFIFFEFKEAQLIQYFYSIERCEVTTNDTALNSSSRASPSIPKFKHINKLNSFKVTVKLNKNLIFEKISQNMFTVAISYTLY